MNLPKVNLSALFTKATLYTLALSAASFVTGIAAYSHFTSIPRTLQVTVDGPSTANVAKFVEFTATASNLSWFARTPQWQWQVVEVNAGAVPMRVSGNTVLFVPSQGSTKYYVYYAGSVVNNYILWSTQVPLGADVKEVDINGTVPPNPTPDPTPPAPPDIPDGQFQLAGIAYNQFESLTIPNKVAVASALANNYAGIASSISAGALTTLNDVMKTIKQNNQATLAKYNLSPSSVKSWSDALNSQLQSLYAAKKFNKISDYAVAFNEIAQGLALVK